jgi:uncharacterized SAM-binding protein YcdF (DUF218 family)
MTAGSRTGRFLKRALLALSLLCLIYGAGLLAFMNAIERREPEDIALADGIVVLTGGADRIGEALGLLHREKGRRLLISGVNAAANMESLRRLWPAHAALFECCVDLDYRAPNTRANAAETRLWAEQRGYRSLILVTASYHMPRAALEFSRAMPGIELRRHVVVPESSRLNRWWQDGALTRIVMLEFAKYGVARMRIALGF